MTATLARPLREVDFADVERQLLALFKAAVFEPVAAVLREENKHIAGSLKLANAAADPLRAALASGRVQFADGVFSGRFSAAISRSLEALGASFDKRAGTYRLKDVPGWIRAEASVYQSKARAAHERVRKALEKASRDLVSFVDSNEVNAAPAVDSVVSNFKEVAKVIGVEPEINQASRERLERDYSENMKLWIRKFSEESIKDLRVAVEDNAEAGYRFDRLVQMIEQRWGVARSKAEFLARQETSLFMSKFRRERFSEAGVLRYRWSSSHDTRVRPAPGTHGAGNHRKLDGRIFEYAKKAPAEFMSSGKPCNPGEDFNCRCVDIPILERKAA